MNLRPSGYEPDELPDCSTPQQERDYGDSGELMQPGGLRLTGFRHVPGVAGWASSLLTASTIRAVESSP